MTNNNSRQESAYEVWATYFTHNRLHPDVLRHLGRITISEPGRRITSEDFVWAAGQAAMECMTRGDLTPTIGDTCAYGAVALAGSLDVS